MSKIAVISNLRIGSHGMSSQYDRAVREFVEDFTEQAKDIDAVVFVGSTLDRNTVSAEMYETFNFLSSTLADVADEFYFVTGKSDRTVDSEGRQSSAINIFTGFGHYAPFSPASTELSSDLTLYNGSDEIVFLGYGAKPTFDEDDESVKLIFAESRRAVTSAAPVWSVNSEDWTELVCPPAYQVEADIDSDDCGWLEIDEENNVNFVPRKKHTPLFKRFEMIGGNIDGQLGLKWLAANRATLREIGKIVITVDAETSKSQLEKFRGLLGNINPNYEIVTPVALAAETTKVEGTGSELLLNALLGVLDEEEETVALATEIFNEANT